MPNSALKGALESLTKTYKYILIDSPAGLENLNRRITSSVNDIFDILDHSKNLLTMLNELLESLKRLT